MLMLIILVNDQGYQDQFHISKKVNAESAIVLKSTERQATGLHAVQRRAVRKQTDKYIVCVTTFTCKHTPADC